MNEAAKCRETVMRILARRDHSVAELGRKLAVRGFSPQVAEAEIACLLEKGYLNDRRYAERWASSALESGRCYGPRLRAELRQRGVDPETVSEVIADLTCGDDEAHALQLLVQRKFPDFNIRESDDRSRRRIFGFLQRRGFSSSKILSLFRNSIPEE